MLRTTSLLLPRLVRTEDGENGSRGALIGGVSISEIAFGVPSVGFARRAAAPVLSVVRVCGGLVVRVRRLVLALERPRFDRLARALRLPLGVYSFAAVNRPLFPGWGT